MIWIRGEPLIRRPNVHVFSNKKLLNAGNDTIGLCRDAMALLRRNPAPQVRHSNITEP